MDVCVALPTVVLCISFDLEGITDNAVFLSHVCMNFSDLLREETDTFLQNKRHWK